MQMLENEVAAVNQGRMYDKLAKSPAERVLEVADPWVPWVAKLRDYIRGIGVPTLEENLDYLAAATEEAISRIERQQDAQNNELKRRIESDEFKEGLAAAVLQTQRTKQMARLKRLALILVNGAVANDLEPESLDDMLRAAVELTDWDIFVLGKMYESQKSFVLDRRYSSHEHSQQIGVIWENWTRIFGVNESQHLKVRAALARLQSVGFISEVQTNFVRDGSLARQPFGLMPEGLTFYERLRKDANVHPSETR